MTAGEARLPGRHAGFARAFLTRLTAGEARLLWTARVKESFAEGEEALAGLRHEQAREDLVTLVGLRVGQVVGVGQVAQPPVRDPRYAGES